MKRLALTALFLLIPGLACDGGVNRLSNTDGRLELDSRSLDFGQQESGSQTVLGVTLTNTGSAELAVTLTVTGDRHFQPDRAELTLQPGELQTVAVTFSAPLTPGTSHAALHFETSSLTTPEVLLPLVGISAHPCQPRSCSDLASQCGQHPECGSTVDCGFCATGECVEHRCEVEVIDAGTADAGTVDAGSVDAGPSDAGESDAGSFDAGTLDAGVDGGHTTDAGTDAGFSVDPTRKYVFTTKATFTGLLGGRSGADTRCRYLASVARLPGTYRALMLNTGETLSNRAPDAGPWYRTDGQLAFQDKSEVLAAPRVPLNIDEFGAQITGYGMAWTGVIHPSGVSGSTCANWTTSSTGSVAKAGLTSVIHGGYIDNNPTSCPTSDCGPSCSTLLHLYCIQE